MWQRADEPLGACGAAAKNYVTDGFLEKCSVSRKDLTAPQRFLSTADPHERVNDQLTTLREEKGTYGPAAKQKKERMAAGS